MATDPTFQNSTVTDTARELHALYIGVASCDYCLGANIVLPVVGLTLSLSELCKVAIEPYNGLFIGSRWGLQFNSWLDYMQTVKWLCGCDSWCNTKRCRAGK